ncbi:protein-L-isoaspartate(D-aspartate) O-methyltransferase [Pontibacter diazotrophicus]|uniref:Protein-L-isoaspartate O-methyltransferase n=1 Tax=Pontibacter diazotrophicus TaxID=1400979 RepID=A0A3D8L9Y5_9BACT|nr:protein-L-isoaspartate(D-aspartate) O-methyltransferase [Pontibacter diazotrophicus]RDV14187.1 protein-L-isoaspartate(D-aspartate) O-methyltransferase [Pontibacter diazotrophicus]
MRTTKEEMIDRQLEGRDIMDPDVIRAMREVDRSIFVPDDIKELTYEDRALPIGKEQTISQPYIVAYMAQMLGLKPDDVVLEVGTGCGYNAAVLSRIAAHVYSVEVIEWLADLAKENLEEAGIENVTSRHGDGFRGWPEKAPFDAIILTAAPPAIPEPLKLQLKIGGKLLAPVGKGIQKLVLLERTSDDLFDEKHLIPVQFVPMTGEAQERF